MANFFTYLVNPQASFREEAVGSKVRAPDFTPVAFEGEPMFLDAVAEARKAGRYTAGEGADLAATLSGKINEGTARDLEEAMDALFGGDGSFARQRSAANDVVESHLRGEVSEGARRQVARAVLRSGVSELGRGAVDDTYAGFLGLTREQLATQGAQEYRSMYALYRQSFPLMSGGQALGFTGLSSGQAIGAAQFNAGLALSYDQLEYQAELSNAVNLYNASLTRAQYDAEPDPKHAAMAQQAALMWGQITGYGASAGASFAGGGMAGGF